MSDLIDVRTARRVRRLVAGVGVALLLLLFAVAGLAPLHSPCDRLDIVARPLLGPLG